MQIIRRPDAKARGLIRYYTGKPCKFGHAAERFVSNRGCMKCSAVEVGKWRASNPDKVVAMNREYREVNPDYQREWKAENRDKSAGYTTVWRRNNPEKAALMDVKRRAAETQATPAWADKAAIAAVYREAAQLAVLVGSLHVDHFYPLNGKLVSGLHVHTNLRIVTPFENLSKWNKLPLDGYEPPAGVST